MKNQSAYYAQLVLQTRGFGHCYVHAGRRENCTTENGISFFISGYGRSLESRKGHKYKVHAMSEGKPVSSKALEEIISSSK